MKTWIFFKTPLKEIILLKLSHSVGSNSLWPHGLWPTRLLCPWDSPGKITGVGQHSLLQGIFPTQASNPGLLHCRWILDHLSYRGSPSPNSKDVCEFWILHGLLCNFWREGVLTFWFLQAFHMVGVDGYAISRPVKGYFIRHYLTHCFLPRVKLDTEIPTHLQLPCSHPPHPRTGVSNTTSVPSGPGPGQSWPYHTKQKEIFIMGLWKVSPRLALVIRPFHTQKGNESWDHYTYAKDALNKMCLKACLHMTSYMSLKGASDYPAGKAYFGFPKCLLTSQVHTSEQPAVLTVLWI